MSLKNKGFSIPMLGGGKVRFVMVICVVLVSQAAGADTFVLPPDDVDLVGNNSTIRSRYEDTPCPDRQRS